MFQILRPGKGCRLVPWLLIGALIGSPALVADEIFLVVGSSLERLDTEMQSVVEVGELSIDVADITFTPDGELWAVTTLAAVYRIDPETAEATELMPARAGSPYDYYNLVVLPDSTVYIFEGLSVITRIDAVTGAESFLVAHPVIEEGESLFLDAVAELDGRLVGIGQLSEFASSSTQLVHVGTAAASVVPFRPWSWPSNRSALGLDIDSEGNYWVSWEGGGIIGVPGFRPFILSAFDPQTGVAVDRPLYEVDRLAGEPASFAVRRIPSPPPCEPSETIFCFQNGRFRVSADWRDTKGQEGPARRAPGSTDQAGLLWFFSPDNWELTLKVLDGCALNDRFWFFLSGTTDVEFTVTVTDTQTGAERTYSNTLGQNAEPVVDVEAFDGCSDGAP